jgi:hypothetical protein
LQTAQGLDPDNAMAQALFGARAALPPRAARLPFREGDAPPLELPYPLLDDADLAGEDDTGALRQHLERLELEIDEEGFAQRDDFSVERPQPAPAPRRSSEPSMSAAPPFSADVPPPAETRPPVEPGVPQWPPEPEIPAESSAPPERKHPRYIPRFGGLRAPQRSPAPTPVGVPGAADTDAYAQDLTPEEAVSEGTSPELEAYEEMSLIDVQRQYVEEHPNDARARLDLARRYRDDNNLVDAIEQYVWLVETDYLLLNEAIADLEFLNRLYPRTPELEELLRDARRRESRLPTD